MKQFFSQLKWRFQLPNCRPSFKPTPCWKVTNRTIHSTSLTLFLHCCRFLLIMSNEFVSPYIIVYCKNIRRPIISMDISWRVFHILTEPVSHTFVSVNRRNNEMQAHIAVWARCFIIPSIYRYKRMELVPLKNVKVATKYPGYTNIFLQCSAVRTSRKFMHYVIEKYITLLYRTEGCGRRRKFLWPGTSCRCEDDVITMWPGCESWAPGTRRRCWWPRPLRWWSNANRNCQRQVTTNIVDGSPHAAHAYLFVTLITYSISLCIVIYLRCTALLIFFFFIF